MLWDSHLDQDLSQQHPVHTIKHLLVIQEAHDYGDPKLSSFFNQLMQIENLLYPCSEQNPLAPKESVYPGRVEYVVENS